MTINRMHKTTLLLALGALLALLAVSCGGESPGDVARESLEAYNQRDFGLVYDLSTQSLRDQVGDRDTAIEVMESSWPEGAEIADIEIVEESVDGDNATVSWKGTVRIPGMEDEGGESTIHLVREDGEWRLSGS